MRMHTGDRIVVKFVVGRMGFLALTSHIRSHTSVAILARCSYSCGLPRLVLACCMYTSSFGLCIYTMVKSLARRVRCHVGAFSLAVTRNL